MNGIMNNCWQYSRQQGRSEGKKEKIRTGSLQWARREGGDNRTGRTEHGEDPAGETTVIERCSSTPISSFSFFFLCFVFVFSTHPNPAPERNGQRGERLRIRRRRRLLRRVRSSAYRRRGGSGCGGGIRLGERLAVTTVAGWELRWRVGAERDELRKWNGIRSPPMEIDPAWAGKSLTCNPIAP